MQGDDPRGRVCKLDQRLGREGVRIVERSDLDVDDAAHVLAPQPVDTGKKVEIIEFFDYACPHCAACWTSIS